MKTFLILFLFVATTTLHALEMDEKLTLRFLKVSNSKKTILINRGSEDGLVVGDHAKFFITSGVIARGIVEKVSPSRSIWSLYRVVDPAEITDGKVLNLKIASPVKVTGDPSKSMKEEEIPAGSDSMSMSEDAKTEIVPQNSSDEQKELEGMGMEDTEKSSPKESRPAKKTPNEVSEIEATPSSYASSSVRNWELWGTMYLSSLSGKDQTDASIKESIVDFSAGIERYFLNTEFFKNASATLFIHKKTLSGSNDSSSDWLEYGAGANYHFYNAAGVTNKPIGFVGFNAGAGNALDKEANMADVKWATSFYAFALGMKYVFHNGFGLRTVFDYYNTTEAFETFKRTLSGPRVQVGLSYRF